MPPANAASDQPASERAVRAAQRAAEAGGVRVELITDADAAAVAGQIFNEVWGHTDPGGVIPDDLLRVFLLTGQYLGLAYDTATGAPLAASAGLLSEPVGQGLHSHVTGVLPAGMGRGLGYAVKLHQRVWALQRGLSEIGWTYDPLIRRNAHFNLTKLGARPQRYLQNFYGEMTDSLNVGDVSDRLVVHWMVADPRVSAHLDLEPAPTLHREALQAKGFALALVEADDGAPLLRQSDGGSRVLVGTPPDAERLRRRDPALAARWRSAQREALTAALDRGLQVVGFTREGDYVLQDVSEPVEES